MIAWSMGMGLHCERKQHTTTECGIKVRKRYKNEWTQWNKRENKKQLAHLAPSAPANPLFPRRCQVIT